MKYQLQPKTAILDSNGLTTSEGWAIIYHIDASTGEYLTTTYQFLPIGVGLPAYAYLDAPNVVDDEHAIVRQGDKWTYPADYRGKIIYSTETGIESIVDEIGDIQDGYTLLKPSSQFDSWNGKKWVLDTNKQHDYSVNMTTLQKKQLINEANEKINYLQDAFDAEIATEQEIKQLSEWKQYRVLLNRIDVEKAPDIDWPAKPE